MSHPVNPIYERDLKQMKLVSLRSPYHKEKVKMIAQHFKISEQLLRKKLIEKLDMMSLECLAVRYDTWLIEGDKDPLKKAIGCELYTKYIPLFSEEEMATALKMAERSVNNGKTIKQAAEEAIIHLVEIL